MPKGKSFYATNRILYFFLLRSRLMTVLPILRSIPLRVVGIPVALAISRFTLDMPKARFHEKDTPGIFICNNIFSLFC
jgi:hypothetical protein